MKTTHAIDDARFGAELEKRGWYFDTLQHAWTKPGALRVAMERDWREALLAAVKCPHEEAGAE
jgi:hypothetical protein